MEQEFRIYRTGANTPKVNGESRIEWDFGCNGTHHAIWRNRVHHDVKGEVEFIEVIGCRTIGPCNGKCGCHDLGSFLHEVD